MSELCTLAASVVLQTSASGMPGAEPLSLHASEGSEAALRSFEQDEQPSVGCDGHHAIASSIAPEAETGTSIVDEVEFSSSQVNLAQVNPSQSNLVSQNPVLQDPLAEELVSQAHLATAIPKGWPSLLHPQSEPEASHQSALPSPSAPRLAPGFDTLLPSPFFAPSTSRPQSGRQLYQQRWAALSAGKTYTRLPSDSFEALWKYASYNPTYQDWLHLLSREARSMAAGQGNNDLTVIVGDSLSLWMPTEFLPQHRFWLNQSISGETAAGMVKRLYMFEHTNPDKIHVMAGINDLKNGATDTEVLGSLQALMQQLRDKHPGAEVIIHSILPTRLPHLPSDRIRSINQQLAQITEQEGTTFLDLQLYFSDTEGHLRQDLTTDGLHLNYRGYRMWQAAMNPLG